MTSTVSEAFVASKFVSLNFDPDGSLTVYSSRTGALGVVGPDDAEQARQALKPGVRTAGPLPGVLRQLADNGLLVPEGFDEARSVHTDFVGRYTDPSLHLIVMPTEQCNFRCVYCYEKFLRGEMSEQVQDGLISYVRSQDGLKRLDLSWFGGEPLLAPRVVARVTGTLSEHCRQRGIIFGSSATTNGSLLVPELAEELIPLGLRQFQISLDGLQHNHDERRIGADGGHTFDTILANLRYLRSSNLDFIVGVRHNFDADSVSEIPAFIEFLVAEFGGDERFQVEMEAIGKWGGANDSDLNVCEGRDMHRSLMDAKRQAVQAGFRDTIGLNFLKPDGYVCYAANPRSFVVGSDGKLYKCTVELDYHDRNIVGQLNPDGTMDLDWKKMALWTETNGINSKTKCTSCSFGGACHGAICPKEWMDEPECGCPSAKHLIHETLQLIKTESLFHRPPDVQTPACGKA